MKDYKRVSQEKKYSWSQLLSDHKLCTVRQVVSYYLLETTLLLRWKIKRFLSAVRDRCRIWHIKALQNKMKNMLLSILSRASNWSDSLWVPPMQCINVFTLCQWWLFLWKREQEWLHVCLVMLLMIGWLLQIYAIKKHSDKNMELLKKWWLLSLFLWFIRVLGI